MLPSVLHITAELEHISQSAQSNFAHLTSEQLNFKPALDKWSIAQCLDHVMVTNRTYDPQLDTIIAGNHRNSLYQQMGFVASLMGKQLLADSGPVSTKSFKNPAIFSPSQSDLSADIVSRFVQHQQDLITKITRLHGLSLHDIVVYSPVSKVIIYQLVYALNIIVAHEQRHLEQAKRVLPLLP